MGDPVGVLTSPFKLVTDAIGVTGGKGPGSIAAPASAKKPEEGVSEAERAAERRRRQVIANQNKLVKTTALGASIRDVTLGGQNLLVGS